MSDTPKRGRGRPKKSDDPFSGRSLITVKLKDLAGQFDPEQEIPVGMVWYRKHRKKVSAPVSAAAPEEAIPMVIEE